VLGTKDQLQDITHCLISGFLTSFSEASLLSVLLQGAAKLDKDPGRNFGDGRCGLRCRSIPLYQHQCFDTTEQSHFRSFLSRIYTPQFRPLALLVSGSPFFRCITAPFLIQRAKNHIFSYIQVRYIKPSVSIQRE